MNPLVSVVIPVYNAEKTIESTLDSVTNQIYKNLEVLVVDDGSTDASAEIIKNYIQKHKDYPIFYYHQENKGVSAARNLGMKNAKGEFIALLDSDDEWDKEKIFLQMKTIQSNPQIDLLSTNRNGEHFDSWFGKPFSRLVKISLKLHLVKNFLLTPTVLFKKEVLEKSGYFDENMRHCEDMDFFLRVAATSECYLLNESLTTTGGGKPTFGYSGLSGNIVEMEKGELRNIRSVYRKKQINFFEYLFFTSYSLLKFLRRALMTFLRNLKRQKKEA